MGAAKRRGTFEQRKAESEELERKRQAELATRKMTPEEIKKQKDIAYIKAVVNVWSER